ncbi:MAG: ABC transporter ATP-binding protein [Candidatus Krumholzibacteriota bacterium]|nr:ABC transporter ATP-binding protein [Candidatus Krumholzibacteriota bacterium]
MSTQTLPQGDPTAPATDAPFLRLSGVSKVYRTEGMETLALSDIDLAVAPGEFIAVMGPSGSGKSTLLHIMGLLDDCTHGRVELDGRTMDTLGDRALARIRNEEIGFVFQTFHLVSDLKVLDNVEIPLLYRPGLRGRRRAWARQALERVGLQARMGHFPAQLSGGQQQRVAIARAIVGSPRLLLADEPTGNLDSTMGDEIMAILEGLNREQGTTIIMVTHDEKLARRAGRIVRLFDGRQVQ